MKARDYIEHNFIPWALFLDPASTIYHFKNGKEEYLCETYNHISEEFKALEFYELYMFRVLTQKVMLPIGMCEVITAKLPKPSVPKDASYIIIFNNEENLLYYTVDLLVNNMFEVVKVSKDEKKSISTVNNELPEIMEAIKRDLLLN